MNTHKTLRKLEKVSESTFPALVILTSSNIKLFTQMKNTSSNIDFFTLDDRHIAKESTTSLAAGLRKLSSIIELKPKEETELAIISNVHLKNEFAEVFRLIGLDRIKLVYNRSKELGYRMFVSAINSLLKSI